MLPRETAQNIYLRLNRPFFFLSLGHPSVERYAHRVVPSGLCVRVASGSLRAGRSAAGRANRTRAGKGAPTTPARQGPAFPPRRRKRQTMMGPNGSHDGLRRRQCVVARLLVLALQRAATLQEAHAPAGQRSPAAGRAVF